MKDIFEPQKIMEDILPERSICFVRIGFFLFISPVSGRNAVYIFEGAGKMELIWVAHRVSDIRDREGGKLQKLSGFGHPVGNEEFLRGFPHRIVKNLSEIAAVQTAESGDILHRDIILKILLDEGKRFFDIEIPHPVSRQSEGGRGRTR